ncbi:HK97 family phage prohead protease [Paracoccus litorisediminis]|uniref:HK97 family phage prohead protease n=1 Tax=Paracoccus litorisediminis TaxID=2006130 RepID=UPI003730B50B
MQTLDCELEIKNLTDEGVIEGYASIFNNVDAGGDKVVPGAFVESLAKARQVGRTVKMLWHHDPSQPIGIWEDLAEDGKGLRGRGRLVMEVPKAREVHALMKAGAVGGLSIGYRTIKAEPEGNVRLLKQVELFEVSPVTFPMNDRAKISSVKADGLAEIVEKLAAGDRLTEREFERMLKGTLDLSNSQAERAARVHLKGQGEPDTAADEATRFWAALRG